jgi:adenylate cyclase
MTTRPQAERAQRKLAAIFAADAAGYSRLMSADERGTLRTLTAHRAIMDDLIAQHGGRIANTAGDSVLAEFPSVVDAVECAVAVQDRLRDINTGVPEQEALRFRIGVHVGDVMVQAGDLLGDEVNVAARVQALADPGAVWLSGRAYEEIEGKLSRRFEDKGEQQVKNIARPIRVFALSGHRDSRAEAGPLPLPDKPSIAVLPFTNMSGDPEQEYFADGITEDLLTALSRIRWLFVIARNSTFVFKGRAIDVKQVGRELGVRYVLEGSVRKAGNRVRVTSQLIEAASGAHIWAERYDRDLTDIFEVQDEITTNVVTVIEPNLLQVEIARARAKRTESLDAYDLYLRALPEFHSFTEEGFRRAEHLLRESVERDAQFAEAWAALADCIARMAGAGWADWKWAQVQGCAAARRAVAADAENGSALASVAFTLAYLGGQLDQAQQLAERAVALNPNSTSVCVHCAWVFIYVGEYDRALKLLSAARRLNPLDPRRYLANTATAQALVASERYEESLEWTDRTLEFWPAHPVGLRLRATALVHLGRLDEAKATVRKLLEVQPIASLDSMPRATFRDPRVNQRRDEALLKAGLPE